MAFSPPPRVLVVGLGSSGAAACRLADRDGSEVWATDSREKAGLGETMTGVPPSARLFLGGHPEGCLEAVGLVVVSPGVRADLPLLETARRRQVPVVSELEFAWLHRADAPLAAVTGSNGKSTTTVLIGEILRAAGVRAGVGGNLGTPASDLVVEGGWESWVLEVSSFQAEIFTAFRPTVAVYLNLSQDHLERHHSLEQYAAAKENLLARQTAEDTAILNADDPTVLAALTVARRRCFSLESSADGWLDGDTMVLDGEPLMTAAEVALSGRHNLANGLAACLAARALGADATAMRQALASFQGLPHRHRTVLERDGVRWVDDSKATNVGATVAALSGYPPRSVHLILGGLSKGQSFAPLTTEAQRAAVRVYLIGSDGPVIGAALGDTVSTEACGTLDVAVARARSLASPGDTVLLAPACASFDQFSGYPERGEAFIDLVEHGVVACR